MTKNVNIYLKQRPLIQNWKGTRQRIVLKFREQAEFLIYIKTFTDLWNFDSIVYILVGKSFTSSIRFGPKRNEGPYWMSSGILTNMLRSGFTRESYFFKFCYLFFYNYNPNHFNNKNLMTGNFSFFSFFCNCNKKKICPLAILPVNFENTFHRSIRCSI